MLILLCVIVAGGVYAVMNWDSVSSNIDKGLDQASELKEKGDDLQENVQDKMEKAKDKMDSTKDSFEELIEKVK